MQFLDRLFRAGMPMLGGASTVFFGFGATYLTAAVLLFFATAVLLLVKDVSFSYEVSLKDFWNWLRKRSGVVLSIGFMGRFIDEVAIMLWPLFLFLFLGAVDRVGYLYSIALFISLILSYFVGWYLGKHKGTRIFYISTMLISATWMFRGFLGHVWQIVFVDTVDRLAMTAYIPVFDSIFLKRSRGKNVFNFHVYRELVLSMFAPFFLLLVMTMFLLPLQWTGVFLLTGFGVLMSLFIRKGVKT